MNNRPSPAQMQATSPSPPIGWGKCPERGLLLYAGRMALVRAVQEVLETHRLNKALRRVTDGR